MAQRSFTAPEYPTCGNFKRKKPNYPISEELYRQMTLDTDLLPIFEQKIENYQRFRNGSLRTNKTLYCRWKEYLMHRSNIGRTPFVFPQNKDYHFSNYLVRYNPDETICNKKDIRRHYFTGPGFDDFGQIPIADDLHLRKTSIHLKLMAKKREAKEKLAAMGD